MTLNIFLSFFFPSSFTIHKIYSVKGCYKLLLPPAVPWPGGFLCPGRMDMAASCPFAGSTSSKAKCVSPRHTQKPPPGPAIEKAPTPRGQPNASRTHVSTESPVPTSSWAGRDRRSPLWAHTWHPPTHRSPARPAQCSLPTDTHPSHGHPTPAGAPRYPPRPGGPPGQIPLIMPDTPAQTQGLLPAVEFSSEFSGKYTWRPCLGVVQTHAAPAAGTRHTGCEPWSRSSHQRWAPRPGASSNCFLGHTPFLPSSWKTPTHPVAGAIVQGHLHPWSGSSSWHPVQLRQSAQWLALTQGWRVRSCRAGVKVRQDSPCSSATGLGQTSALTSPVLHKTHSFIAFSDCLGFLPPQFPSPKHSFVNSA